MILPLALACALASSQGCEQNETGTSDPTTAPIAPARKPVLWKRIRDAQVVALNEAEIEAQLAQATAEARRTLDDARQRWTLASAAERMLWAVKWAAPLATPSDAPASSTQPEPDARLEHIWVQPLNWSPFRIEGVLLSEPIRALESGRAAGEIVSFPIEDVGDWIHFAADPATNPQTPFEGGFTLQVLEEHYGRADS